MPTSTLTSKGQITVPKPIREHLRVAEGDQVDFAISANGDVVMHRISGSVSVLAGLLYRSDQHVVSVEEMHDAIGDAAIDKAGTRS